MPQHISSSGNNLFSRRLRELIDNHDELSISELGRRIGHKTGTAISALISKSKSGRDDLRMSTFLKICSVLAKAYKGKMSEIEITLYLIGFSQVDTDSRIQRNGFEYPVHQTSEDGAYYKLN